MASWHRLGTRVALALLVGLTVALPVRAQAPAGDLLHNGSFEAPYHTLPAKDNCHVAAGWHAYWLEGSEWEVSHGYRLAPEYKPATRWDPPLNRVRSGELAQQFFHSWGNFQAGVLQQVPGVRVGDHLRFQLWGMTWSCDRADSGKCSDARSGDPSPMHLRIGIDPYGGVDPMGPNVVWSPEQNAYDDWHLFSVDARALAGTVTVFVYSYPDYRSQNNDVYLDDASLVSLGRWRGPDPEPGVPGLPEPEEQEAPPPVSPPSAGTEGLSALQGELTGSTGGAYVKMPWQAARSGRTRLRLNVDPFDAMVSEGVGFDVYGPSGLVAQSAFAGTHGVLEAEFDATAGAGYLIQVYNYLQGRTVRYSLVP